MKRSFVLLSTICFICISCGILENENDGSVNYTPKVLNDGIEISDLESENIDPTLLGEAYNNASRSKIFKSLLVSRNGRLVAEHYFQGSNENSEFEVRSVTKSVVSLLTGIAIRDGYIESLDQKVSDILPECFREDTEPEKYDITIKNILTMTSGIDDYQYTGGRLSSALITINSPHAFTPGSDFKYTDMGAHIMAVILNRLTGSDLIEYANQNLFEYLGESVTTWLEGSDNNRMGGSGLELTGREMLKLGLLVQNNGSFGGNQVVPSEWIEESTRNQVPCREENEYGYGYFWWVPGQTDIAAIGYAGQYIYLYRDHNAIVIATTEANVLTGHASIQSNYIYGLLQDYIIPSFLENQN